MALVVAFARCLKSAGHIYRVDVHTRRELAVSHAKFSKEFDMAFNGNSGKGMEEVTVTEEEVNCAALTLSTISRYSAVMVSQPNVVDSIPTSTPLSYDRYCCNDDRFMSRSELPPKKVMALDV